MELTNLASFERLTGRALFTPAGATTALPFGNIKMLKLSTNPKNVEVTLWGRGKGNLAKRDISMVSPVYELTTDQWSTATAALQYMGTRLADAVQASATGSTASFTAAAGQAYLIGKYGISVTHVKVASTEAVAGTDYFVDDPTYTQQAVPVVSQMGVIVLPQTLGAVITDGSTFVVTYDTPAETREKYDAFSKLNRSGTLVVHAEDENGVSTREIWTMVVQLSSKTIGDIDPSKLREAVLEAAIFGSPIITRRAN